MDFDEGWKRVEGIGLFAGLFVWGFLIFSAIDEGRWAENKSFGWVYEDIWGWIFTLLLSFAPWLTLLVIKWVIDGFRSKENQGE